MTKCYARKSDASRARNKLAGLYPTRMFRTIPGEYAGGWYIECCSRGVWTIDRGSWNLWEE